MRHRRTRRVDGTEREDAFQARVVQLMRVYGWSLIFHQPAGGHDGRVSAEQLPEGRGFPDLLAVHERLPKLVVAELKATKRLAEERHLRPGQLEWLQAFARLGLAHDLRALRAHDPPAPVSTIDSFLWTPEDWDEIQEFLRVGQTRRRDLDPPSATPPWDLVA